MEKFLDVLLQILLPFMTILISIAVAFAIKYISKGFAYIEAKVELIEDEKVRTFTREIPDGCKYIVASTNDYKTFKIILSGTIIE